MASVSLHRAHQLDSSQSCDPDAQPWQRDVMKCLHVLERSRGLRSSSLRPRCDTPCETETGQPCTRDDEDRMQTLQNALNDSCRMSVITSPHKTQRRGRAAAPPLESPWRYRNMEEPVDHSLLQEHEAERSSRKAASRPFDDGGRGAIECRSPGSSEAPAAESGVRADTCVL